MNLSPRAMRNIRCSGNPAPSVNGIDPHLEQTIRILVEHTDIELSGESSEGDTVLHMAVRNPISRPLFGWLSQKTSTEFDVDHRNGSGMTLLMSLASCTTYYPGCLNNMKVLLALGADLDARALEKPETYPRDIGARALHFAVVFYYPYDQVYDFFGEFSGMDLPEPYFFEKARYLLSQGASPHAMSATGHTATDRVIEFGSMFKFVHWRWILLELGFDLKAFVREEIDIHADVPWYASNGCDEFVLGLFGFKPKLEDSTGTIEILALSDLSDLKSAEDGPPSPLEEDESDFDLFDDTESEHVSSSNSDYESVDEDLERRRRIGTPKADCTELGAVGTPRGLPDCPLPQYRPAFSLGSEERRIWQAYVTMLDTGDTEGWAGREAMRQRSAMWNYTMLIRTKSYTLQH